MGSLSHAQSVTPEQDLPEPTPDANDHQQPYGNAAAGSGLGGGAPRPDDRPPLWLLGGGEVTVCPFDAEDQDAEIPGVELILGQEARYPFFEAAVRPKGLRAEHEALLREFGVDPAGVDAATATRLAQALDEVQDLQACVDGLDGACEDLGDGDHEHSLTLPIEGEQTETWSTANAERSVTLTVTTAPDGSVRRHFRYSDICGGVIEGSVNLNHDQATPPAPSPDVAPTAEDEEGLASFFEGAFAGDLADNNSWSAIAGQTLVGFIPVAGQLADVRDTAAALKDYNNDEDGAGLNLLLTMISFIPGGDILKAGKKVMQRLAKGIVPGAAESLVTKNLDEGVEAVTERGAKDATKDGAEALNDEVRGKFVAALGEEATQRILQRFGAKAMAHYGPEFLGTLRGVTQDKTMKHLREVEKIDMGEIVGCHDADNFLSFINGSSRWEIVGETPFPGRQDIVVFEYRPFKLNKDLSPVQPKEFKGSKAFRKSVIRGLVANEEQWFTQMSASFDSAVRECALDKGSAEVRLMVDGVSMLGYLRNGVMDTLFPFLK